jgi:hypothetical protein
MSDFTVVKENETEGVLRYKGRKCGTYTVNDGKVDVDISTSTGSTAWESEFGDDLNKINEFFGLGQSQEADKTFEEELSEWRENLLAMAEEKGNIAAILKSGDGKIYKGPATQEKIDDVLSLDEVEEVLNAAKNQ